MNTQYNLKRSRKRRKTISLQIGANSEITVYAPYFTPDAEISSFIAAKQGWIDRTLRRQSKSIPQNKDKIYSSGEIFYYLGQAYPLEAYFEPLENQGVMFWKDRFFLNCPENNDMRRHYFEMWYKKKAMDYIPARVSELARTLKLTPKDIRITQARRRWGSCSADNSLAFSFRLMMAAPEAIDYVAIHELMHIRQKNHSSKFWRLVIEAMPQCQSHRRWLRDHQHLFEL